MNCFTEHFQTLFQYFFGTFHIVLSIYFVHFIRMFLPYSLQSCILFTSDAANFIPDTIILNLQPWHLTFTGFLISQKFLSPTNLRKFYKFLSPAQIEKIFYTFLSPAQNSWEYPKFSPTKQIWQRFHKFFSSHKMTKILQVFVPQKFETFLQVFVPGTNRENFYKFLSHCQNGETKFFDLKKVLHGSSRVGRPHPLQSVYTDRHGGTSPPLQSVHLGLLLTLSVFN